MSIISLLLLLLLLLLLSLLLLSFLSSSSLLWLYYYHYHHHHYCYYFYYNNYDHYEYMVIMCLYLYCFIAKCEPVQSDCGNIGYSMTSFPNLLKHTDHAAASTVVNGLINFVTGCSEDLKRQFVCSIAMPKCVGAKKNLLPCRSLCTGK